MYKAIFNPSTKKASIAYIDSLTKLSSINDIFNKMQSEDSTILQVHLAGGDGSSRKEVDKLLDIILQTSNIEIKSCNLIQDVFNSKYLAIDSRSGEVYTEFHFKQLELGEHFDIEMQILATQLSHRPLNLEYDAEKTYTANEQSPSIYKEGQEYYESLCLDYLPGSICSLFWHKIDSTYAEL